MTAGPIPQEQADALVADAARPAQRENRFPVDEGDAGIAIVVPASGTASSALVHSDELLATFCRRRVREPGGQGAEGAPASGDRPVAGVRRHPDGRRQGD